MERTKVKFRKIGGGSFRLGSRIVKPNEVFIADPDEIPVLFHQYFVRVEDTETRQKIVRTKKKFEINEVAQAIVDYVNVDGTYPPPAAENVVFLDSPGWYKIVNSVTGKQINAKKLRKDAATKLAEELNG
jgi:hypothetical protein